jgi:hypothetical protein
VDEFLLVAPNVWVHFVGLETIWQIDLAEARGRGDLPYRLQADKMNPDIRRDKQEFIHNQMTLTPAHKDLAEARGRGEGSVLYLGETS